VRRRSRRAAVGDLECYRSRTRAARSSPASPPSAAELASLYGSVGRELKALDTAKGQRATYDLWPRFRWIRLYDYLTTPERRQVAAALLGELRSEISTRQDS